MSANLSAANYFRQGKYAEAFRVIDGKLSSMPRESNLNFSARILQIMILIEKGSVDLATARIESLRKQIARYDASDRVKAIAKVLAAIERGSFMFGTMAKEKEYLRTLRVEHPWDAFSFEFVRFEDWLDRMRNARHQSIAAEESATYNH